MLVPPRPASPLIRDPPAPAPSPDKPFNPASPPRLPTNALPASKGLPAPFASKPGLLIGSPDSPGFRKRLEFTKKSMNYMT